MNSVFANREFGAAACCILAIALSTFASKARADVPGDEPAIARAADDAGLQWGGCPDFLPAGCAIAVLHGDPSKPNVDIFFKLPAKSEIPLHTHTSAERMVLVAGELQVTYEGQAAARLTPGHIRLWAGRTAAQRRLRQRCSMRSLHRLRIRA